jgi:hypothetical protein
MKNKYLLTVKYAVAAVMLGLFGLVGGAVINEMPALAADTELSVTIIELPFSLTVVSPSAGGQVGSSFSLDVSGSNISTVDVYIDFNGDSNYDAGELVGTFTVDEEGSFGPGYFVGPISIPTGTPSGSYNMKVVGYQKATGSGTTDVTIPIDYTQSTPQIDRIEPDFGDINGGTNITITGQNFNSGAKVYVGGKECLNTVVVSSTVITCTTPTGTEGRALVTIIGDNGNYTDTYGFLYVNYGGGGSGGISLNAPGTGLFRFGDTVVMSSDLIIAGLAALVILLTTILFKENRQSQHKSSKVSTSAKKPAKKTPTKRVRSKKQ